MPLYRGLTKGQIARQLAHDPDLCREMHMDIDDPSNERFLLRTLNEKDLTDLYDEIHPLPKLVN